MRLARDSARLAKSGDRRPGRGGRRPRLRPGHLVPARLEVIDRLERADLLPAIAFVFSRAGCDAAVEQALRAGVRLTAPEEAAAIDDVVSQRTRALTPDDRSVLGFDAWSAALRRGVSAHHAGLLPMV